MKFNNIYDVTNWPVGNPYFDLGEVINSMIADIKTRQKELEDEVFGKPGAVIRIPPGDYKLKTQVTIDISFLRIEGYGHGFTSSSIRFNVPRDDWSSLKELWPGGSRVIVDIETQKISDERSGAAFLVSRSGNPRISSVEFAGFCIDGLHFEDNGLHSNPENSYVNKKTGIYIEDANDSFRVIEMGFVYLEHALTIYKTDALTIHNNFIAECGSCIELRGWGQASKITDNLIGAGPYGYSIFVENHGGVLISSNNVFPRGKSSVFLKGVRRSSVTNNRLHSFYPGMLELSSGSSEVLVAANHFLRDSEPWTPFLEVDNGLDDLYGVLVVDGNKNSIIGNHFSEVLASSKVRPSNAKPIIVRVAGGTENFISNNHMTASEVDLHQSDDCYEGQVESLLDSGKRRNLKVISVKVDSASTFNTVLDSGTEEQIELDVEVNVFRATPSLNRSKTA